jgi:hypothetical protein
MKTRVGYTIIISMVIGLVVGLVDGLKPGLETLEHPFLPKKCSVNSYNNWEELWIVDTPVITAPFSTRPRNRHDIAKELENIAKSIAQLPPYKTQNIQISRKFNSSILYLKIKNINKFTFENFCKSVRTQSVIPFARVLLNKNNNDSEMMGSESSLKSWGSWGSWGVLTLWASLSLILILTLIKLKDLRPPIIILVYIISTTGALLLSLYNHKVVGETTELETKVLNDLIPYNKNYMHLYASSSLKSMVGELTLALLQKEGYSGGIRILNEDEIFSNDSKKTKADSLWISSTAKGKKIAETKAKAENIIKNFLKENHQESKNQNSQSPVPIPIPSPNPNPRDRGQTTFNTELYTQ